MVANTPPNTGTCSLENVICFAFHQIHYLLELDPQHCGYSTKLRDKIATALQTLTQPIASGSWMTDKHKVGGRIATEIKTNVLSGLRAKCRPNGATFIKLWRQGSPGNDEPTASEKKILDLAASISQKDPAVANKISGRTAVAAVVCVAIVVALLTYSKYQTGMAIAEAIHGPSTVPVRQPGQEDERRTPLLR
jgi:hypothetical protein